MGDRYSTAKVDFWASNAKFPFVHEHTKPAVFLTKAGHSSECAVEGFRGSGNAWPAKMQTHRQLLVVIELSQQVQRVEGPQSE